MTTRANILRATDALRLALIMSCSYLKQGDFSSRAELSAWSLGAGLLQTGIYTKQSSKICCL